MTFGSLCSGIEAPSAAWSPLGWECRYVAEVEPFPCAYLAHRHGASRPLRLPPGKKMPRHIEWGERITNHGDMAQIVAAELPAVDIVAAGFPCQGFSIAGLRGSLSDARSQISIIGVRLLLELAASRSVRGAVLENVPDILNTADNAWGSILGGLVGADDPLEGLEHGGKWPSAGMVEGPRSRVAWRVLDAQRFGLAQRRERVWAVIDFGDGPDPAAVLFERQGVPWHSAARGKAREDVAGTLGGGARGRGGYSEDDLPHVTGTLQANGKAAGSAGANGDLVAFGGNNTSGPINVATARTASHTASGRQDFESETFVVAHDLRAEGFDASEDGTGRGTPLVPVAFTCEDYGADAGEVSPTLRAMGHSGSHANGGGQVAIAFNARQDPISGPVVGPVDTDPSTNAIAFSLRGREGGAMPEVEGGDVAPALRSADGGSTRPFVAFDVSARGGDVVQESMAVRRITVVEAERLQGFADNETLIPWPTAHRDAADLVETVAYLKAHGLSDNEAHALAETPDGPRYKAIGNSWPVPVAAWIGRRIEAVEALFADGALGRHDEAEPLPDMNQ